MRTDEKTFADELRSLAKIESAEVVQEHLEGVRPEDIAEALPRLSVEEGLSILSKLPEDRAAYVLVEMPDELVRAYVEQLPDATVAHYLDILPMDDALDLADEMPEERFEALMEVIPEEDAQEIERLRTYGEDSVGRLMVEDFVSVPPEATARDILRDLRTKPEEEYETINDIYVLSPEGTLQGVFSLRKLLRASPRQAAAELMQTDVVSVRPELDAEDAARIMARYGFYALPVTDADGTMHGIFTVDDAHEVIEEADTEDVLALGAVSGDVDAYLSLKVVELVKRRLPWLLILFLGQIVTGFVLRYYNPSGDQTGTAALAQLIIFIPLLIGAGGNSGSQVTTTMTRALAVGEIRPGDFLVVLRREFMVALVMGLVLGVFGSLWAHFIFATTWNISLIVGLALPAIVIWATVVGSVLPLAAKSLGADPAVMSAPFISTFVDATGLVIYFEIARRIVDFRPGG